MSELVSVIMGVYNCESTLTEAIQSIIDQTYSNWELIICDDGSQDESLSIAQKFSRLDSRIKVIKNESNMGLNKTLNKCLNLAKGRYIARMDGDDISLPSRFQKEVSFLEGNSEYAIVSSSMIYFDERGDWGICQKKIKPTAKDTVCSSPICHAPVMMLKECYDSVDGYSEDERVLRVEDVDLWIRLYAAGYRAYNIQEPLYKMRNDKNAFTRRKYKYRINSARVRLSGCKKLELGFDCYLHAISPMIIGLIPAKIRMFIRKKKQR